MKILQIIDSLRMGGAQKLVAVFADEILQHGHQVEIISLMSLQNETEIFDDLKKLGVFVRCFPLKNLVDLPTIIKIVRYIKTCNPDIVHTQLNYANIVGTCAARISRKPSVASLHNSSIHLFDERRYRTWLETWILRSYAHRIIACGYTVAKVQQPRFKEKPLLVIPNPVPLLKKVRPNEISDFRKMQLPEGKGILLVAVGRLITEKGYPDMIQAISQVQKQTDKGFKLVIVGNGPLLGQLQRSVMELGLEKHISFTGQRNDVPVILAAGDIYISTSHFEGQSIAVMEAMTAGLPVIATEVGDNHIVIPQDCGILAPVGQPEIVANQILRLMNDFDEREKLGEAASRKVKRDYSPSLWIDKLLNVYQEVLNE